MMNSRHHRIKYLIAEIPAEEFQTIETSTNFWYFSLRKKYYQIVERKLHFTIDNKPGDIIFNGKIVTNEVKKRLKLTQILRLNSFSFENPQSLRLNEWFSQIKRKEHKFVFPEFGNSLVHIYEIKDHKDFDYIVIPAAEILKRFYLYTSKLCQKIDEFGLFYDEPELNPVFDTSRSRRIGNRIFITLNKKAEHNFHGVWAKFLWNPKLGKNLRKMFNKHVHENGNLQEGGYFNIDIEWPEDRVIGWSTFEGRGWTDPHSEKRYFMVSEVRKISNEAEWKNVKIRFKPKNDNEQIPDSDPEEKEVGVPDITVKNPPSNDQDLSTGGHGGIRISRVVRKRDYLLYDSNIGEKKKKKTQKTTNKPKFIKDSVDEITDGEEDSESSNGGVDIVNNDNDDKKPKNTGGKDPNPNLDLDAGPVPHPKSWQNIDGLYQELLNDVEIDVSGKLLTTKLIGGLLYLPKLLNINYAQPGDKTRLNDRENFVQRSVSLNSHSDKAIRQVKSVQFSVKGKNFQFIEVESISTGSTSYVVIDKWIPIKKFSDIFIKERGKHDGIKRRLSKIGVRVLFRNHPDSNIEDYCETWKDSLKTAFFVSAKGS